MFPRYKAIFILFILLLLALVIFFSLYNRGMSEDQFIEIYVRLSIAQEKFGDDTDKLEAEREKIFSESASGGFSQKKLEKFLESYRKNPQKWIKLWGKINQRLSELIEKNKTSQSK